MILSRDNRSALLIATANLALANQRLTRAINDPELNATLPGELIDCNDALTGIINAACGADYALAAAITRGVRDTRELIPGTVLP